MDEIIDELEPQNHGLELQKAILHVLDGRRHHIVLSDETLDLEETQIEAYVKRYVNRCRKDTRSAQASFLDESGFAEALSKYFHGELSLSAFSAMVCDDLIHYFEHEEARSFECLFIDYREDDVPYLAVILLEEIETLSTMSGTGEKGIRNTISFGNSALPAVSKPVGSFAVINMLNEEIRYVDENKWKDSRSLLCEVLLKAKPGISGKKYLKTVQEIACEVADEYEESPAVVLGKVKNHIAESVKEGMTINTETLVEEVFEEQPKLAEAFRKRVEEVTLPKKIEVPAVSITPSFRKQRIRTDTGIEITFPAEYFQNNEFIEFRNHSDGTITIEIKQIGHITNKV